MSVLGIDFGTTFCSASWVNPKTGFPEAITFPQAVEKNKIPSMVFFPPQGDAIIGFAPYQQIEDAITSDDRELINSRTITGIKRKLRRDGSFLGHSHIEIISLILKYIINAAQRSCQFSEPVDRLVLTHPVVFDEWKKCMLKEAASLAGFSEDKVTMLEEPISAALSYINSSGQPSNVNGVLVYDFGGGTFDIAYVRIDHHGQMLIPVDPQCDPQCGGIDIDHLLYDYCDKLAYQQFGRHLTANQMMVDEPFLSLCRKHKESISNCITQTKSFQDLLPTVEGHGIERLEWNIRIDDYNNLISPIIEHTMSKAKLVVDEVRRMGLPLDVVLLIGGSSRIPLIKHRLTELLGKDTIIKTPGDIDTAVAIGASYHAMGFSISPKSQSEVRYCYHCGSKLEPHHKFCMICGCKKFEQS